MNPVPYLYLILAWLFFGLSHSILAAGIVKREALKRMKGSYRYYRVLYSVFATAVLVFVIKVHLSRPAVFIWQPWPVEKIIAMLLLAAGLVIMIACTKKYFRDLSGIDSILGTIRPWELQTKGMHKYVRHPLYSGTLLFAWSIFLYAPYWHNLISCTAITVYTLAGIYFEEKKLLVEYGDAYAEYQKKVPGLLPFRF